MIDAMVTARMSSWKKEAGNEVLSSLGSNASKVINDLYDYLIKEGKLPFPDPDQLGLQKYTQEQIQEAKQCVDSLAVPIDKQFAKCSLGDVRKARLAHQGLTRR